MSVKLTKEQLDDLKEDFKNFDKDGNGTISAEEFRSFIKKHNKEMTDIEIDMALIMMDALDGDGKVNFEEFLSMQTKRYFLRVKRVHKGLLGSIRVP